MVEDNRGEDRRRLGRELEEPPPRFGPIDDPHRWYQLQQYTRNWISGKSEAELKRLDAIIETFGPDEIEEVKEALKLTRDTKTVSRFLRWLGITFFALFAGAVAFGDNIARLWRLVTGGK